MKFLKVICHAKFWVQAHYTITFEFSILDSYYFVLLLKKVNIFLYFLLKKVVYFLLCKINTAFELLFIYLFVNRPLTMIRTKREERERERNVSFTFFTRCGDSWFLLSHYVFNITNSPLDFSTNVHLSFAFKFFVSNFNRVPKSV